MQSTLVITDDVSERTGREAWKDRERPPRPSREAEVAAAVSPALLEAAIRYVGAEVDVDALRQWQFVVLRIAGIQALIAAAYSIWPRKAPARAVDRDEADPAALLKRQPPLSDRA